MRNFVHFKNSLNKYVTYLPLGAQSWIIRGFWFT